MNVVNHTPFPAEVFEAVDQHGQQFHVFVLKQTLNLFERHPDGWPTYAEVQAPLCERTVFFADEGGKTDEAGNSSSNGSIRQESDYCPFKPACDVIVNASAHAPSGVATAAFPIRLRVARATAPALALIDKTLTVTGERHFYLRPAVQRLLWTALAWASLGLVRRPPWRLSRPSLFTTLPLRDTHAYGGQNRIDAGHPGAAGIGAAHRLTPEQLASHPDAGAEADTAAYQRPVAHAACMSNLAGAGFATGWFLRATGQRRMAAPRIEAGDAPLTALQFCRQLRPQRSASPAMPEPAGLGIRPLLHPARHRLTGRLDSAFIDGGAALPADFDFAIWNCVPPDQQIDFLHGDEIVELHNLCRPDTPGAIIDPGGNTVLRVALPPHECLLLLEHDNGARVEQALAVDTVLIEPEDGRLILVWRTVLSKEGRVVFDTCAFGMQTFAERDRRQRQQAGAMRRREREAVQSMRGGAGEMAP